MDGRVLNTPWLLRLLVVYAAILPTRPAKSAKAYASVWTPEGSPLIVISKALQHLVQEQVPFPVELGMRYGNPSIAYGLNQLLHKAKSSGTPLSHILLVPLYPHYAMSSFETVVEKTKDELRKQSPQTELVVLPPFFNHPDYISALCNSIKPHLEAPFDKLLFSYHGLPEDHLIQSDPTHSHCLSRPDCCSTPSSAHATCYRHQCFETTRLVTEKLGLKPDQYTVSFQSRLGRKPWLKPYTDFVLNELPQQGVKRLLVVCPAFVSDCLETLEEIAQEGKHQFLSAGGESYTYIPCLNTQPQWVNTLSSWLVQQAQTCVPFESVLKGS